LEKLARELRISDFQLEGEVTDEILDRRLADADIVCCLRFPSLEGSSCSLAEAMSLGKAIITTDTGCYAELPEGLVLKVRPEREAADLPRHLRILIESPDDRLRLGGAAAGWIKTESCPSRYADMLLNHLETVVLAQPLLRCAEKLGSEAGVLELAGNDDYILHLESRMKSLWPG
jgi:glycosyltransferase involved in cell wall biosynthesis